MTAYLENGPKTIKALREHIGERITIIEPFPYGDLVLCEPRDRFNIVLPGPYEHGVKVEWMARHRKSFPQIKVGLDKDGYTILEAVYK